MCVCECVRKLRSRGVFRILCLKEQNGSRIHCIIYSVLNKDDQNKIHGVVCGKENELLQFKHIVSKLLNFILFFEPAALR